MYAQHSSSGTSRLEKLCTLFSSGLEVETVYICISQFSGQSLNWDKLLCVRWKESGCVPLGC